MARRKRREFSEEFKADAVKLAREGGRSLGRIAKDLDLTETSLREWVRKACCVQAEGYRPEYVAISALGSASATVPEIVLLPADN